MCLSHNRSIDGPFDLGLRTGPDGDVHDGSVLEVKSVHSGIWLVDGGIWGETV